MKVNEHELKIDLNRTYRIEWKKDSEEKEIKLKNETIEAKMMKCRICSKQYSVKK